MIKNVFTELFIKNYAYLKGDNSKNYDYLLNDNELEDILRNYIETTMVYKTNYMENLKEVDIALQNIILNSDKYTNDLLGDLKDVIKKYSKDYIDILDSKPLTKLFIESINKLNSSDFNIKDIEEDKSREINTAIRHKGKSLELIKISRINEDLFPTIYINDIDKFENTLLELINTIKYSESFYNIFNREGFSEMPESNKLKMIFEGILLNLTNSDALNADQFINNYINYINNPTFDNIKKPTYISTLFDDELYVMSKKSELWYETPYYLSFMLRNKMIELPNVRIGITENNNKLVANILATQTSQRISNMEEYELLQEHIKKSIPTDSYFRFINPTHLISLIITFGLLKGLGIEDVIVKDYMPYRYKKVVNDKQYNDDEANNYQTRLTTKNITTYMRIVSIFDGIDIVSYPENSMELSIRINDNVIGNNEFVNSLFYMGYSFGKKLSEENKIDIKK